MLQDKPEISERNSSETGEDMVQDKPEISEGNPEFPQGKAYERMSRFAMQRGEAAEAAPTTYKDKLKAQSKYLKAFYEKANVASEPNSLTWRCIGPFSVPHGQSSVSGWSSKSYPAISGRVSSIAIDPNNSQHILIGPAAGGIWQTKEGGETWEPVGDEFPCLSIGAIAFDPSHPGTVYAGTGEGNTDLPQFSKNTIGSLVGLISCGLLKSTDGGNTWKLHPAPDAAADTTNVPGFINDGFYDLIVDPKNGQHILAATTTGLYQSKDGGQTWNASVQQKCWSVSIQGQEILAACHDGLHQSVDGGSTWTKVTGIPSSFNWKERMAVCHVLQQGAGGNNAQNIGVAYVFAYHSGSPKLWRREDQGSSFDPVSLPSIDPRQALYDWFVGAVGKSNKEEVVYLGAIDIKRGTRDASGNWTWKEIAAQKPTTNDPNPTSIHSDQHTIAFDPKNLDTIYVGNDGGVYRSTDGGHVWESLNKGLCILEVEFMAQHPKSPSWLLAGAQDNGTSRYVGGEVWHYVQFGDGGDCAINDQNPYICYSSYVCMKMYRSDNGGGLGSWHEIGSRQMLDDFDQATKYHNPKSLFYPPVEANGNTVAIAGAKVYISTDDGGSWTHVSLPQSTSDYKKWQLGSAIAILPPAGTPQKQQVFVGTHHGNIYRVEGQGSNWHLHNDLTSPRSGAYITDIIGDAVAGDAAKTKLWVTYGKFGGGKVYYSEDTGKTWHNCTNNLPDIPVNAIVVDPKNHNKVYIGTDHGVYTGTYDADEPRDKKVFWQLYSKGLPNVIVGDLLFHKEARLLRAGTKSRGVWEISVPESSAAPQIYLRASKLDSGLPYETARRFRKDAEFFVSALPNGSQQKDKFFNTGSLTKAEITALKGTMNQTGNLYLDSPFQQVEKTSLWRDCQDIKVDSEPFTYTADGGKIDFVQFEYDDLHRGSVHASTPGLQSEDFGKSAKNRIYVQVHNCSSFNSTNPGKTAATGVVVNLYYKPSALPLSLDSKSLQDIANELPELNATELAKFPKGDLTDWIKICSETIEKIKDGSPEVVKFELDTSTITLNGHYIWLLAIVDDHNKWIKGHAADYAVQTASDDNTEKFQRPYNMYRQFGLKLCKLS